MEDVESGNKGKHTWTLIYIGGNYYECSCDEHGEFYYILNVDDYNSSILGHVIVKIFDGLEGNILTGICWPKNFETKRVVVIQME